MRNRLLLLLFVVVAGACTASPTGAPADRVAAPALHEDAPPPDSTGRGGLGSANGG